MDTDLKQPGQLFGPPIRGKDNDIRPAVGGSHWSLTLDVSIEDVSPCRPDDIEDA
jgi:hypothetical protein